MKELYNVNKNLTDLLSEINLGKFVKKICQSIQILFIKLIKKTTVQFALMLILKTINSLFGKEIN